MACENKLIELMLIDAFKRGKIVEKSTHPFQIPVNDTRSVEIFKASCHILQPLVHQ